MSINGKITSGNQIKKNLYHYKQQVGIVLRTNVKRGVGIFISDMHFLTVVQITYIKQGSVIHELCDKTALRVILPTGHLWRQKKDTLIEYELADFTKDP